jgi:FtsZ-interacting cell division protein ZipA
MLFRLSLCRASAQTPLSRRFLFAQELLIEDSCCYKCDKLLQKNSYSVCLGNYSSILGHAATTQESHLHDRNFTQERQQHTQSSYNKKKHRDNMPSVGNQTDSHQPLRTNILQTKQNPNNMIPPFSSSTTYLLDLLQSLLRNNNDKRHSQTPCKTKKLETPIYKMRPNSVSPTRFPHPPGALSVTATIIFIMCSSSKNS